MAEAKKHKTSKALVIGGGIAGVAVSVKLGLSGIPVHLIEKTSEIGGHVKAMGCKATDVCLRCNVCVANEVLRSAASSPSITLYTSTEILDIREGVNGSRFQAILSHKKAPKKSKSGENSFHDRFMSSSTGPPNGNGQTVVDIDSIIIATGYEPYNPLENSSYGYGSVPNVITGIDAEKQLEEKQKILRVSDGTIPERIAFIQCVGSRTQEIYRVNDFTDYCSTVCCAYALRMGRLLKYQSKESQITLFYMDIQNFGKGFDSFYKECKNDMKFICSRPYEITNGENDSVRIKYASENNGNSDSGVCEEEFDLVVLSVGIRPPADAWSLADTLSIAVDQQGFFGLKNVMGLPDLQREGIYVVGASESPKDIAGCIAQAEAVSALVLSQV